MLYIFVIKVKTIKGYDLPYQVDTEGVVWLRQAKIPVRVKKTTGYQIVHLRKNGRLTQPLVHRLVLETFVGPCPLGKEARHFPDRDRTNNQLSNLSWATPKENQHDKFIHGTHNRADRCGTAKLTWSKVRAIRRLHAQGGYSYLKLGDMFDVDFTTIGDIIRKDAWKEI